MKKICYALALFTTFGLAQSTPDMDSADSFAPMVEPEINLTSHQATIVLDGVLDPAEWQNAAKLSNFSETFPGDQSRPPIDVRGMMAYDQEHLYLAFEVKDDPANLRYSLRDRDQIWQDDYVGILLDTYGDGAWAYFLFSNPLGVQGDSRFVTSGGEDDGFDIIFESEGQINAEGYTVEMAIPFRSLRFPDREEQVWRVNFWITHPRDSRRTYSWAAIDRDTPCFLCQYGTIRGITGIQPGRKIELLPAIVGSQAGQISDDDDPKSSFNNEDPDLDLSLTAKYSFSSNLTADVAINPDFSQVEADAAEIDVNTTFALFFPERRPFFQEGSDLFSSWVDVFYTRTLNNPLAAGRITGRFNRTSIAYIGARDRNTPIILPFEERSDLVGASKSVSNILRIKQTFSEDSFFGFTATDRRLDDGGNNTVGGADLRWQLGGPVKQWRIESNWVFSHTEEPKDTALTDDVNGDFFDDGKLTADFDGESFNGNAGYISLERDGRNWISDFDYWHYSPRFRADNGFIRQNNIRRLTFFEGLILRPNTNWIDQFFPQVFGGYEWNFQGTRKDRYIVPAIDLSTKGQTSLYLQYLYSEERFRDIEFKGIRRYDVNVNSNFSNVLRFRASMSSGRFVARGEDVPVLGRGYNVFFSATFKPLPQLNIEPRWSYARLLDPTNNDATLFDGYILRTRVNYQFTRRLFLRLVAQYNDFSDRFELDPLISYKVNPFTVFYLGSTVDYSDFGAPDDFVQTERQFFFKFQYLIRP